MAKATAQEIDWQTVEKELKRRLRSETKDTLDIIGRLPHCNDDHHSLKGNYVFGKIKGDTGFNFWRIDLISMPWSVLLFTRSMLTILRR